MFPDSETMRAAAILVAALAFEGLAFFLVVRTVRATPRGTPGRARKLVVQSLFATALTLLCLTVAFPTTRLEKRPARVKVIVDDSLSMTRKLKDGAEVRDHADALVAALKTRCERRGRPVETRFLSGASSFSGALASPLDDLEEGRESPRPGALLLLTDGIANPPSAETRSDVRRVVLGASRPALNWRLAELATTPPDVSSDDATVEASIELDGADAPRSAVVELWRKRDAAPPERVWSEKIAVDAIGVEGSGKTEFRRTWQIDDASGLWLLAVVDEDDAATFSPEALRPDAPDSIRPKETQLADNAQTFSLDQSGKITRVLLIDDLPRWEYRYLRETLRREPTVELQTLLLAADPEVVRDDPIAVAPDALDRATLARFDVAIVGDLTRKQWQDAIPALPDVVTREGSTTSLWLTGAERLARDPDWRKFPEARLAPGTPVDPAPVEEDADLNVVWRVAPTALGRQIWTRLEAENLPELTRAFSAVVPSAGTATLLVARRSDSEEDDPLILARSLGKNAILWQATDEMWRLQTLDDKSVYRSFVLQTLDYLTSPDRLNLDGDADVPLETLKTEDVFDYFAPENARRLATLRELENVAADATDAALDLRNLSQEESLTRFNAFLNNLDSSLPDETTPVKRPILPLNLLFPVVIALFLLTMFL